MGKPVTKQYTDSKLRVCTFRIAHGKLTAFQLACERQNVSVSKVLNDFIDTVIGGGDVLTEKSVSASQAVDPSPLIDNLRAELDDRLARLEGELENIVDPAHLIEGLQNEMQSLASEVETLKKL